MPYDRYMATETKQFAAHIGDKFILKFVHMDQLCPNSSMKSELMN